MSNNLEELKKRVLENKVDYEKIKKTCFYIKNSLENDCYINLIIAVKNRTEFSEPFYNHFIKAKENFNKKICLTVVENDEVARHKNFFKHKDVNYVFIKNKEGDLFNKCLCYNVGASLVESKYIIFHDLDILIKDSFFLELEKNKKKSKAIQCYTNKRVLNLNASLTQKILDNKLDINILNEKSSGIKIPGIGSKGGSILVERNIFYKIGGFDPELFAGYSPEDQFFWEKLNVLTNIFFCDSPPIEIFHMKHENQHVKNPFFPIMENTKELLKSLSKKEKKEFINFKQKLFK